MEGLIGKLSTHLIIVLVFLSSLVGYLHWGSGNEALIGKLEMEMFGKFISEPSSLFHPFIILPLLGQLLLLYSLFTKSKNRKVLIISIICIGLLYFMILVVGIMSKSVLQMASTLPFFLSSALLVYKVRSS
ncbi:MAG TPA: hypothetical protein P5235_03055 [Saprospiraceae bacterium]|nr:hypothetical protein [Saprospiraceae bacterium]MCB9327187.1 hypothetical protein [Lewinellaceae bacterium]HRX28335.1 hypothetical protein [Saprospiraceae bacterium]